METRLKTYYRNEVVPFLMKNGGYKNVNEVPKLEKIVLNMGLGEVKDNSKSFNIALDELTAIAGQKAVPTHAKKAISDFKGISPKSFDGKGNYAMGIKEQLIFPEIVYDKVDKIRGLDVMIVTSAKTDKEALELLKALGMPFSAR